MIIYIPQHLQDIKVVKQMRNMISEYLTNEEYGALHGIEDMNIIVEKSFDYIYDLLNVVLPDNDEPTNRYLAMLFYELKGTPKLLTYLEKYLGLIYREDPVYDINSLTLNFEEVSGNDLNSFKPALTNFLNALLYFNELHIAINIFKLMITSGMSNKSSNACVLYKENYFEFK